MKFFYQKKHDPEISERQVINDDLMQRILSQIRKMSAKKIEEEGHEIFDLTHVNFKLDPVKWENIPKNYGKGVTMLKIPFEQAYVKKAAVVFDPQGEIFPHFSNSCHEIIQIEKGYLTDKMVNDTYGPGSVYFIPKGAYHHLFSLDGAYLTVYYVYDERYQKILDTLNKK